MTSADLLRILFRNKKIILINCLVAAVLSVLVTLFIMDEIFQSVSVIKSTSKATGLSGMLPDIGGLEDLAGGLGSTPAAKELALYENILMSRRCVEGAITHFDLLNRYEFKKLDDAIKYFRTEITKVSLDKLAGTLELGVYDKDPRMAKEINNYLIDRLNEINIEMNVLDAKNNRIYIEQRYGLIKSDLKNAEDSLKMYQDRFGISPDLQIKATAQSLIQLETEIKSEEIKLDLLKKILSPDEAEVRVQQEKIHSLTSQLESLRGSEYEDGILGLKGAPGIAMNYLRLARNVEIQNKLLTFIIPILEQSKIDENKTTPTIMVLDPPSLPDKKAKPKRSYIVIGVTLLVFILTYSYFLFAEKWYKIKRLVIEN